MQILWLLRLAIHPGSDLFLPSVLVLILLELVVPIWAEVAPGGPTTFNPHHIAERYGGFTLIVLGEAVASATVAFRAGLDEGGDHVGALLRVAVSGLVILFALWWLYFDRPAHTLLTSLRISLLWGYGHYFIFAAAAAVGAGLGVAVDHTSGHSSISDVQAGYAVAVPVATYLFFVWLLHLRPQLSGVALATIPVGMVLTLVTPLVPGSIEVLAVVLVGLVVVGVSRTSR